MVIRTFAQIFACSAWLVVTTAAIAAPSTLGNYPDTSVILSADATVTPDANPGETTTINVSASINFDGELEANPATGVVRVTNAHPAGAYTITVTAFNGGATTATKTFALTVTTPAACPQVTFARAGIFALNRTIEAVVVGDFNGDGKQDLAAAKDIGLAILLGAGTGQFGLSNINGTGAYSMAVGDFNGDGKQDLVTIELSDASDASIRLGDGAGQFGAPSLFTAGRGVRSVAIGDFNGDGKQDLAVAKRNTAATTTGAFAILLGDGLGHLGAATDFGPPGDLVSITVGDFNGDGKQDLAAANYTSGTVSIFLGNGAGSFSAATNFGVGTEPVSIAVGDFNADGKQDLAVANYYSGNVSILLGNGAGGFSAATNFVAGGGPLSVAVGDFNGDGKQDLAFANSATNDSSILLGDGSGNFSAPTYLGGFGSSGSFAAPSSVSVGDFNGDGKQDLAVAAGYFTTPNDDITILLRDCAAPTPTPSPTPSGTPGPATHFVVSADSSAYQGFSFPFQVTAKDQFNNTVAGYAGTVHFTASCPSSLPPNTTLPNGTHAFRAYLYGLGSQTITASDTSDPSITGTSNPIFLSQEGFTPTPTPTPVTSPTPTPTPIPGALLDTITGASTTTIGLGAPRTYMGDGWTNNMIPAGSTSVKITGLTLYMLSVTTQSYTDVTARIQFWNNYNPAATPVFTNASGPLITVDLGPQNLTASSVTAIPVTLATPLILPGGPGTQWGFAQNFQGDTGSGLADTTNLTSPIAAHSNGTYSTGQITTGTAPQFGYYRNASGRTDFNFDAGDARTLPSGVNAQGIAIVIFGAAQVGGTPSPSPTASASPSPTASASPSPSPTASASPLPTGTISPPGSAQSLNLSSRLLVQTGDAVGIAGFIISGSEPKRVIVRAVHCQICIPEVSPLSDPVLELHGSGGGAPIVNDNWRDTQEAEIIGTGLMPDNDSDSAIIVTLPPGNHTAIVRGKNNTSGVALVEVYDLNQAAASKLANISTRAFVSTGGDILIAGFILGNGTLPDNLIIRGIGPSLGGLGVANALADPRLELRDSNGTLIRSNNNWQDDTTQAALLNAASLAPTNTLESGIAVALSPGQYTALLEGANNGTGVGLVEVYDLGNQ